MNYTEQNIYFYARRSLYFHIGIIVFIIAASKIYFNSSEKLRNSNIKLIHSSVKVDVVGMPKLTLKQLKALPPLTQVQQEEPTRNVKKVAIKEAPVVKDQPVLKKKANFLSMLKKVANKNIVTKKTNSKKKLSNNEKKSLQKLILEGNKISEGTAVTGEGSVQNLTEFDKYITTLPSHISQNWVLPPYLHDKGHTCRIRIYLSPNGKLIKAEVYDSSGNEEFNERAMRAVKLSSPFPAVPDGNHLKGLKGEIILAFPF